MGGSSRYDEIGVGYGGIRRPDPAIARAIEAALGGARRIVNVGAGTGSYEPTGRCVAAVEPSAVMIGQRSSALAPAVQARAEELPLADAALAVLTVMHWDDLARGLAEMRRVAARTVILTIDPAVVSHLWMIKDYAPEMARTHGASLPPINDLASAFPGAEVRTVPVPRACTDGFMAAFWGRPEAYLDPEIRRATSPLAPDPRECRRPGRQPFGGRTWPTGRGTRPTDAFDRRRPTTSAYAWWSAADGRAGGGGRRPQWVEPARCCSTRVTSSAMIRPKSKSFGV